MMLQKVATYTAKKKCSATLVFDGNGLLETTERYQNIVVIYTPSGVSADTRIKRMIDETLAKSTLCVVSSDNEILNYAKISQAKTMNSEKFLSDLNAVVSPDCKSRQHSQASEKKATTEEHKPSEVSASDIEKWKELFE